MTQKIDSSQNFARNIRAHALKMVHAGKASHIGTCLSMADILAVLYTGVLRVWPEEPTHPDRDRFILSKGHGAAIYYAALAQAGFIPVESLATYGKNGSVLTGHVNHAGVAGVEVSTGSLGHGLGLGCGMALGLRADPSDAGVFVLLSDGECDEGSVWEAAMFAPAQKLDGVVVMIDYNKWQATGRSDEIMALAPLAEKWRAFGWDACEVDGHDMAAVLAAISREPDGTGRPRAIIAHTVKGKGVSFMEDDNNWHYRIPTADEVRKARVELGQPEVRA
jgi:transketolase